jgi:hypothetical protein
MVQINLELVLGDEIVNPGLVIGDAFGICQLLFKRLHQTKLT